MKRARGTAWGKSEEKGERQVYDSSPGTKDKSDIFLWIFMIFFFYYYRDEMRSKNTVGKLQK